MTSEQFKKITSSMQNKPEEWDDGAWNLTHTPTGLEIYTSVGFGYFEVEKPVKLKFSWWQQFVFWIIYENFKSNNKKRKEIESAEGADEILEKL